MPDSLLTLMSVALAAGFAVSGAVIALALFADRLGLGQSAWAGGSGTFVFEGDCLIDTIGSARRAFRKSVSRGDDWSRVRAILAPDFPDVASDATPPPGLEPGRRLSRDGSRILCFSQDGGTTRITVCDTAGIPVDLIHAAPESALADRELKTLRAITDRLPYPVWRQGVDGRIDWVNRAFLDARPRGEGASKDLLWPPQAIFDEDAVAALPADGTPKRLDMVSADGDDRAWHEVRKYRQDDGYLFASANVDVAVQAEKRVREFTQTLTKTFADLAIGLAIFDSSQRLVVFNPALTDLTTLPFAMLSARPTLTGFLDQLRERRMIPEPKDYKAWRQSIEDLVAAAANGSYSETWSLPTGQTYHVTGRPHPDGSLIFLIQDISAEISLTRRFRAELDLGRSVIDSLPEAIAVFGENGIMTLSNAAYRSLWGDKAGEEGDPVTVADATQAWRRRTAPTSAWGDLLDFVSRRKRRSEWVADIRMTDGRAVQCRFVPIANGATLVAFRVERRGDSLVTGPVRESA